MPTSVAPKSSWAAPQTIVGLAGLISIGYGSYLSFQADVGRRVSDLEVRVSVLETKEVDRDRRIDILDREDKGEK